MRKIQSTINSSTNKPLAFYVIRFHWINLFSRARTTQNQQAKYKTY